MKMTRPNNALQRTRLCAPLSFRTLGDTEFLRWLQMWGGPMTFDEARSQFSDLLHEAGWPGTVLWVNVDDVLRLPGQRVALFRPPSSPDETLPRTAFESGRARGLVIRMEGLGQTMGRATYATVELADAPDQGEKMFPREGVKISVADPPLSVVAVTSRFFWWLVRRSHARWQKRAADACRVA